MKSGIKSPFVLAFDLGTGGNKAVLFDAEGESITEAFVSYPTSYPRPGWHEQRPVDWWEAVVRSTRQILSIVEIDPEEISCCALSGHSLGVVPIDRHGNLLRESTPIWSDSRSGVQSKEFFNKYPESQWYWLTGNGFPPPLYSVFKIMWYRDQEPEIFSKISRVLGTKDYINFRLTGHLATDHSYASGSGVYDLKSRGYSEELINAAGLPGFLFPEIFPSTEVVGTLTSESASELGLSAQVKVICGGVDNSCMALGAGNLGEGDVYNSQGSSSWIAVTSKKPILDEQTRPFVFDHVLPGLYNSAIGIFSTGTSFRWIRDQFFHHLIDQSSGDEQDVYAAMTALAGTSPPGANGLIFHPNMAGGSSLDPSPNLRGAFVGLDLRQNLADVVRAVMEGIALQQRIALDVFRQLTPIREEMLVVGGGSRSPLWRQIHADIYGIPVFKTRIDQEAAAIGAAALAANGMGLWNDFEPIRHLHREGSVSHPDPVHQSIYEELLPVFRQAGVYLADLGDRMRAIR